MFCSYCGKEIPDGSTCDCPGALAHAGEGQAQQGDADTQQRQESAPQFFINPMPTYTSQPVGWVPVVQQSNGMAVAGFVLALIGLFLSFVPVLGWIIWVLGLIFSIVGIVTSGKRGGTGKGLAIAGLIISCLDLILLIVLVAGLSAAGLFGSF